MAEASCSGGTPFKRLIDQQSPGLGTQQDRLVDRAGISGNNTFRSETPTSSNGYGAFVSANAVLPGLSHDPASRLAVHASNLQPPASHAEFHRSSPVPELSNWAADFARFSAQPNPAHQPAQMMQPAFAPKMSFASSFGMPNSNTYTPFMPQQQQHVGPSEFGQEMSRWMSVHGGGNMQDVDAMMDRMARELEQNEAALGPDTEVDVLHAVPAMDEVLEAPEIGSLSLDPAEARTAGLEGEQEQHTQQEQVDADNHARSAVAEAAERLLDCVKHEGGEKWENSVFLSLMRDFRDGRKDIVGDEILAAADASLAAEPQT